MDSFSMTKKELVVLFELLGEGALPTGLADLPAVSEAERSRVEAVFVAERALHRRAGGLVLDKGLEAFLRPVFQCSRMMMLNHGRVGVDGRVRLSLYSSGRGLTLFREEAADRVSCLRIDSEAELRLLMPEMMENSTAAEDGEFLSYLLVEERKRTTHLARALPHGRVLVEEASALVDTRVKSRRGQPRKGNLSRQTFIVEVAEYRELLGDKLREVCHVSGSGH